MKITPIDIAHKSFNKKMFGLDENEVLDFMQNLATQMEELIHERNSLKELVREKEIQLNEFKERDQVLKSTIATASQMSDRLRSDAEREAKLIVADAQQKAEIIVRDSRDSLRKMYTEISELKRARLQFEANLKALAQAHITLLESGDRFMPNIGLNNMTVETETTINSRSSEVSPLSIR
ncbi:MAG: DivIVA domain-containing protein [Proteobacteria bacterium]|jgi:cell division initiation protein|nr:DivIVA domain-containing protein [Pseudomonadota bacterium]